jgi:hypothetical protein
VNTIVVVYLVAFPATDPNVYDIDRAHFVKIVGEWKDARAFLVDRRTQKTTWLNPSKYWWPMSRLSYGKVEEARPSVVIIRHRRRETVFGVRFFRDSGVYGYTGWRVYCVRGSKVSELKWPKSTIEFSDKGSMTVAGEAILWWDFVYGVDEAHHDNHKYSFSRAIIDGDRLKRIEYKITRNKYEMTYGDDGEAIFPRREDDPLVEFGLRWKAWGPRWPAKP